MSHFTQLKKEKYRLLIEKQKIQRLESEPGDERFYSIPILGMASCGTATQLADEVAGGYLNISKNVLRSRGKLFAVRVVGDSMNSASVPAINNMTSSIKDGDFVIVDTSYLTVD